MDDGQEVKNGGVTLCTDSFTFEEVDLLKAALESKFNILTTIHNKKGKRERKLLQKNIY
jgi:LAGLIDADG DNA endonuclease family